MTEKLGTLTGAGTLQTSNITRHEHHKIFIKVSSYVSTVTLRIEDVSLGTDAPINLHGSGSNYTITADGGYSYLLENERVDMLQFNFVSGDATIEVYYRGW